MLGLDEVRLRGEFLHLRGEFGRLGDVRADLLDRRRRIGPRRRLPVDEPRRRLGALLLVGFGDLLLHAGVGLDRPGEQQRRDRRANASSAPPSRGRRRARRRRAWPHGASASSGGSIDHVTKFANRHGPLSAVGSQRDVVVAATDDRPVDLLAGRQEYLEPPLPPARHTMPPNPAARRSPSSAERVVVEASASRGVLPVLSRPR